MAEPLAIVWLRADLRLADNPALDAACKRGGRVLPLYIHAPEEEHPWEPGGASRWWLHKSLQSMEESLLQQGSKLVIRRGPSLATLFSVIKETGADAVFWNRRYESAVIARDTKVKAALRQEGYETASFNAALLREPWTIENRAGKPFQVFTPFWKCCLAEPDPPEPLPAPRTIAGPGVWPTSLPLPALGLQPRHNWASGLESTWTPGEGGARARLDQFLKDAWVSYSQARNRPDKAGTSKLSPHLHFGEISPRQVWHGVRGRALRQGASRSRAPSSASEWRRSQFLAELGWREFAHHLLYHFPHTPQEPLRAEFKNFPWSNEKGWLKAWQQGRTGYPIVDAGMRELRATGWMHNRVRMIVASFLVKDLLISWEEGARWFWDTLVDADLAQNTLGWQWTAGCGADAAPYFRVFNPVSQGEKFDPDGDYVRRWCPELAGLPARVIHQPEAASSEVRGSAGIELGKTYPNRVVSHAIAREVALEAFAGLKS